MRRGSSRAATVRCIVLVAIAFAPLLLASPPLEEPARAHVMVVRSGSDLELAEETVQRALEGHFADLGYDVHVDFAPAGRPWPPAAVQVELTLDTAGGMNVAMRREADAKPWSRALPPQPNADVMLESLGVLIRSMLGAPLPGPEPPTPEPAAPKPAAPEPSAPERPAPETPSPAPRPRFAAFDLALGYRGDTFAASQRWHSSVGLDLAGRTHRGLAIGGGLIYAPPHAGGGLNLQRIGGDLRLGAAFRPEARLQPAAFGLVAVEALGWSGAPAQTTAKPGWATRIGIGASAELRLLLGRGWLVAARLNAVGWALGTDLEEARGSARSTLLHTTPFAGQVWIGVGRRFGHYSNG